MVRFSDIVGQDAAVATLRKAFDADRLAHGLIFAGPEGVGKATTAAALAAMFLCQSVKKGEACGVCDSCRGMSGGTHPDHHIITKELARIYDKSGTSKATQIAISVVREEIAARAGRKTVLGRGKVFVIEQAELMTTAAQNALLKTLEEPAGRTLIILLTSEMSELLATVRSRCQSVRFGRLDTKLVIRQLRDRGIAEGLAADAAELCDGSLGVALRWIEGGVLEPARSLAGAIDAMLAGKGVADFADLLRKSAEAQVEKTLARDELSSKDSAMRNGLNVYLSIAARRLRGHLADAAEPAILDRACGAIDAVARAEKYLDANVNVTLVLEQLGLALR